MPRIENEGLDETIRQMDRLGLTSGKLADEMLNAGAEHIKKAWVSAIDRYDHIDNGDMRRNVGYRKPKNAWGKKTLEVYPIGKGEKGVRNAEKAFVLHYGRKNMTGSHFVDAAEKEGEPKAEAAMLAVFDDYLNGG